MRLDAPSILEALKSAKRSEEAFSRGPIVVSTADYAKIEMVMLEQWRKMQERAKHPERWQDVAIQRRGEAMKQYASLDLLYGFAVTRHQWLEHTQQTPRSLVAVLVLEGFDVEEHREG